MKMQSRSALASPDSHGTFPSSFRSTVVRYAVAVLAPTAATVLASLMPQHEIRPFLGFYFAAVMVTSWYGTTRSGLLSIVIGALQATYFLLRPRGFWISDPSDVFRLVVYLILMLWINYEFARRKRAIKDQQTLMSKLRDEQQRLETVLFNIPVGVIIAEGRSGQLLLANNAAMSKIWRRPLIATADVSEYAAWDGFHVDGTRYEAHEWPLARSIVKGEFVEGEKIRIIRGDGTTALIEVSSAPVKDEQGNIIAGVVVFLDVTEKETALAEQRKQAEILDIANDAIMVLDLNGNLQFWNKGSERLYGWSREEVLGRCVREVLGTEFPEPLENLLKRLQSTGEWSGELTHHTREGNKVTVSSRWTAQRDASGRLVGTFEINRDVSVQKKTEQALMASERLAAVGRLAALIAHELNNPLDSVANVLWAVENSPNTDTENRELLRVAQQELEAMSHIARQTLGMARDSKTPSPVLIGAITSELCDFYLRKSAFRTITVDKAIHFDEAIVAFPSEIRQVISNLLVNAFQAAGTNARVRLRVHSAADWRNGAPGVRLTVANPGGIPAAVRTHIFDPFFTTKDEEGSGLGLWVTKSIVENHGGSIRFRSSEANPPGWTCFSVFLPLNADPTPLQRRNSADAIPSAPKRKF